MVWQMLRKALVAAIGKTEVVVPRQSLCVCRTGAMWKMGTATTQAAVRDALGTS